MARTTIPAELVAINAIQGTLIADNAITAVHIATNAVSGTLVADNAITSTHIAQNNVTATQIAMNTITVTQLADSAVETAKLNNDAVTQAKIADDAVGADQLAANSVVSASIVNGTIVAADLADNAVTLAKMASLARGSIIYGDSAGDPAALAVGSNGQVLTTDGTDISWGAGGGDGVTASGSNTIIQSPDDTNVLYVNNSAKVGIGTTSPSVPLDILTNLSSDTTSSPDTVLTLATKYASTGSNGAAGAGTRLEFKIPDDETNPITGAAIADIKEAADDSDASAGMAFYISQNDTTLDEAVRIDHDGKVGIGTTSPAFTNGSGLEIQRDGIATLRIEDTGSSGKAFEIFSDDGTGYQLRGLGSGMPMMFSTVNTERMRIDSDGKVGMSGSLRVGSNGISGTTAISGEILRLDSAGDNTPIISMVQANARLASIGAYYSSQAASYIFLAAPEGSIDRTAIQTHRFYGEGDIATTLGPSGTMTKWFMTSGNYFTLGGLTSSATSGTGNIHSIHFIQSGKITFGDWTDANALGICEGTWNEEGTDRDYISFHHRNSMNWYGNSNGQTLSMATGGGMSIKGSLTQNQFSDMRLKRDIVPLESILDKVNSLDVFNFNYMNPDTGEIDHERNRNTGQIGLSAQQTEKLFPQVVEDRERIEGDNTVDNRNWKYLEYEKMTPILVKAVQELTAKVKELEEKLEG